MPQNKRQKDGIKGTFNQEYALLFHYSEIETLFSKNIMNIKLLSMCIEK